MFFIYWIIYVFFYIKKRFWNKLNYTSINLTKSSYTVNHFFHARNVFKNSFYNHVILSCNSMTFKIYQNIQYNQSYRFVRSLNLGLQALTYYQEVLQLLYILKVMPWNWTSNGLLFRIRKIKYGDGLQNQELQNK